MKDSCIHILQGSCKWQEVVYRDSYGLVSISRAKNQLDELEVGDLQP